MSPLPLRRFVRIAAALLVAATLNVSQSDLLFAQKTPAKKKDTEAAKRQYNVALGFEKRNLHADAIALWEKFVKDFPTDSRIPHAKYHLGICRFQQKKFAVAATTFRGLVQRHPKFEHCDAARFNLGLSLFNLAAQTQKAADYAKATAAFADVVAKHPTSSHGINSFYYRAECAFQTGDKPAAVAIYQQAIQKYPKSPQLAEIHYALGTTQEELKQFPAAAATYQTFLRQYPKDARANECKLRLGMAQMSMKKVAAAQTIFTQLAALKDFKLADYALLRQAECATISGNVALALNLYESLPRRFPKSEYIGASLVAAGRNRFQSGQYQPAQRLFTDVINRKLAEADEAAYWLARTLIQLKNPATAIAAVRKAIAANPKSPFLPHLELTRIDATAAQPKLQKSAVALYATFAKTHAAHPLAAESQYQAASLALKLDDHATAATHAESFLANTQFSKSLYRPRMLFVAGEAYLLRATPDMAKAQVCYRQLIAGFPKDSQLATAWLRVGFCLYSTGKPIEAVKVLTTASTQLKAPDQLAEAHLLIGRCHADGGRHKQALAGFAAASKAGPKWNRSDEVHYLAGISQRALNQNTAAVSEFNKVVRKSPTSPYRANAHLQLAEMAFSTKKYAAALSNFTTVIKSFPKSEAAVSAHYGSASVLYAQGNDAQAVNQLTTLLKQHPKSPNASPAKFLRGLCYRRQKKFDLAVKDLTAFLAGKVDPSEAENARYSLALCHVGMEKYAPAITGLTALLKANPKFPDADRARYELGFAYLKTKAASKAAETFRQLVDAHPKSPLVAECWIRIGEHHENNKQPAEAAKAFSAGIAKALKPELQERLRYRLGWVYYSQADYGRASVEFAALLKQRPNGALMNDAAYLAGDSLYRQNKFPESLAYFSRVIGSKSKKFHAEARYRSGDCAAQAKQWAASRKHYEALIAVSPKFPQIDEARYGLGFALQNLNKPDDAIKVYEQVTRDSNTTTAAKCRFMIGEIEFGRKQYVKAVKHFIVLVEGYNAPEWQGSGYYDMGQCFIHLKNYPQARKALETLKTKFAKHARAKDAALLLKSIAGK